MIRLDTTTRKLQVVLAGAVSTNQLPVVVSYSDKTSTTYNGATQTAQTNGTTAVDICAAPASSTIRDVDYINIYNADTSEATITVRCNDNGTLYQLVKTTLKVGSQITYTHSSGWQMMLSDGSIKSGSSFWGGISGTLSDQSDLQSTVESLSPALTYGRNQYTSSGLTWGYYGGNVTLSNGTMSKIANGTLTLTASATNYIVANKATGVVSASTATTNWNDSANYWRLYSVVVGAATVTSYTDSRELSKYTGSESVSGNLNFTGVGARVLGDFSNATIGNRVLFKTNVPNGNTSVGFIPNGMSTFVQTVLWSGISANENYLSLSLDTTNRAATIISGVIGAASAIDLSIGTSGAELLRFYSIGRVLINNSIGFGYGNGSGGTVTQPTSRTTGVAINKPNGDITLFTAAGSATPATFTVSNNLVGLYDVPTIAVRGATNKYITAITNVVAGASFDITFWTTGGTATDTPIFHFNLGKGSIA